ncbi:MAG: hypothetical protein O7J95_08185 [Planctomycetota bacterium]|nr:hypothetical protein [Planctomycetota bacterium]
MNFLAHGYLHVDRPYFLAGTALPDWLRLCGRRLGLSDLPEPPRQVAASPEEDLAAGHRRHLADDARFHADPTFVEVARRITEEIRERAPDRRRIRVHFLGHALAEMLLDAWLMGSRPGLMDRYYGSLASVDPSLVERIVDGWPDGQARAVTARAVTADSLAGVIDGFRRLQFLRDYESDDGVLRRIGQVTRRLGLDQLPGSLVEAIGSARRLVDERAPELLAAANFPG